MVVQLAEERFAVRLDVHHHPEDVRRLRGEGLRCRRPTGRASDSDSWCAGARPSATGRSSPAVFHAGSLDDPRAVTARRRRCSAGRSVRAAGSGWPAARRHGAKVPDVLAVVNLVEGCFVVVGDIHADQIERAMYSCNSPGRSIADGEGQISAKAPRSGECDDSPPFAGSDGHDPHDDRTSGGRAGSVGVRAGTDAVKASDIAPGTLLKGARFRVDDKVPVKGAARQFHDPVRLRQARGSRAWRCCASVSRRSPP